MSGLLSYSGLTTKIRAMQSHLLNDQNFREIVELESVPQAVSYLKQHKGYEDLFEGYNEADLHRGQIEKMLRLTVYRFFQAVPFCKCRAEKVSCTLLQTIRSVRYQRMPEHGI